MTRSQASGVPSAARPDRITPSLGLVFRIATALGVPLDPVFTNADEEGIP